MAEVGAFMPDEVVQASIKKKGPKQLALWVDLE